MPKKEYPFGNMTTLNALKGLADNNWKQKIVDQCRDMINSSIKYLTGEDVSVTSLALGKASSKLFYESREYNTRKELMQSIKAGDVALYKYVDKAGDEHWHASLYLGKDRSGKQVWYESAGYIGKHPDKENRWYKNVVVDGVPFVVGKKDRERIETGRISVERDKEGSYFHMNVANALVSEFGSPVSDDITTYYKLPLKYELFMSMTQEELWNYQDYLLGLSRGYKSGVSDYYYDDTHFHSMTEAESFEINKDKFESTIGTSRDIMAKEYYGKKNNSHITINIRRDKAKKEIESSRYYWGGSW